jgi:hypothetical protein
MTAFDKAWSVVKEEEDENTPTRQKITGNNKIQIGGKGMVVSGAKGKIIAGRGINVNGEDRGNVIDAKDSPLPSNFRWNSSGDIGATKSPKRKWSPKRNVTAFDGEGNPIKPDERGNIITPGDAFVTSNRRWEEESE